MELREYMSIRRAYNLVRQGIDTSQRLTFAEFAILCKLAASGGNLLTSEIAEYQSSLRPTTTHRTKHLADLGYIERSKGPNDKRNVVCTLTEAGEAQALELCENTRSRIGYGMSLSRVTAHRVRNYITAMGSFNCMASDLLILGLYICDDHVSSVSGLVDLLGLLQPTVSMSVVALEKEGMVFRDETVLSSSRLGCIRLTQAGEERAKELEQEVVELVVHRGRR